MVRCMLFLAPLVGLAVAHKPMERLMQTTKEHRQAATTSGATAAVSSLAQAASSALPAAMPDPQLKEINEAVQNGVDAFATFSKMATSDAFKLISQNATVIESVVSNMKILSAFKGFDTILQGGLTPEKTVSAFNEGMKNALDMVQLAMNKMGDPSNSVKSVTDIIKDPLNADLVAAMNKGDKAAFDAIAEQYTAKDFPGINYKVLETIGKQMDTRQLLEKEGLGDLMKMVIDQDPVMSDIIRNPPNIPEMVKELTGETL